jgi:MFS family permease
LSTLYLDPDAKPARHPAGPALRVLRNVDFRRYLIGQLVSNTGTWMQRAAQDLLILKLTGDSGSSLGILTALQFLPQTLFGLYGGVLADRYGRRRLLLLTQTLMAVQSLLLGALTVTGTVTTWHLYALAFALGAVTALDSPTRNAFVAEMVTREQLPSAVSLSTAQFNIARIAGPAAAGLTVASGGSGVVFLVNAVSYLAVIAGLLAMGAGPPRPPGPPSLDDRGLRDAFRHVRARPRLLLPISLIALVGTFGFNFQVSMALMATTVFHSGAAAFGYLSAAYAAGSLIGALRGASRGTPPGVRRLAVSAVVFGVLEVAAGLTPGWVVFMAVLVPTGMAAATVITTANAMTQLNTDPAMRGRVMSIYLLVLLGGTPIGAPLTGLVSDTLGARYALVLGGLISALAAVAFTAVYSRGLPGPLRRPPRRQVNEGCHPR